MVDGKCTNNGCPPKPPEISCNSMVDALNVNSDDITGETISKFTSIKTTIRRANEARDIFSESN